MNAPTGIFPDLGMVVVSAVLIDNGLLLSVMTEVQDKLLSLRWLPEEYNRTATAARQAADLSLTLYRGGASCYPDPLRLIAPRSMLRL